MVRPPSSEVMTASDIIVGVEGQIEGVDEDGSMIETFMPVDDSIPSIYQRDYYLLSTGYIPDVETYILTDRIDPVSGYPIFAQK